jgi:YD repeat-containing protein
MKNSVLMFCPFTKALLIASSLLGSVLASAQSKDQNYVMSRHLLDDKGAAIATVTYYNGLEDTYYIYNNLGQLRYVLTPEYQKHPDFSAFAYQYEYDAHDNLVRIQFANGNVTKYVYSAEGVKLKIIHYTAMPNISVADGDTHELTKAETQAVDSVDFLLLGNLVVKNGRIDKYLFWEGYCLAQIPSITWTKPHFFFSLDDKPITKEQEEKNKEMLETWNALYNARNVADDFSFYYYNKDLSTINAIGHHYISLYDKKDFSLKVSAISQSIPTGAAFSYDTHKDNYDLYLTNGYVNSSLSNCYDFECVAYHETSHRNHPEADKPLAEVQAIINTAQNCQAWGKASENYIRSQASYAAKQLNKIDIANSQVLLEKLNKAFAGIAEFYIKNKRIEISQLIQDIDICGKK